MSEHRLPDGFTVKEYPGGVRWWMRDGHAFVIARPHPIAGLAQTGWQVSLINVHGAVTVHIPADELDHLAAWHCQAASDVVLPGVPA